MPYLLWYIFTIKILLKSLKNGIGPTLSRSDSWELLNSFRKKGFLQIFLCFCEMRKQCELAKCSYHILKLTYSSKFQRCVHDRASTNLAFRSGQPTLKGHLARRPQRAASPCSANRSQGLSSPTRNCTVLIFCFAFSLCIPSPCEYSEHVGRHVSLPFLCLSKRCRSCLRTCPCSCMHRACRLTGRHCCCTNHLAISLAANVCCTGRHHPRELDAFPCEHLTFASSP